MIAIKIKPVNGPGIKSHNETAEKWEANKIATIAEYDANCQNRDSKGITIILFPGHPDTSHRTHSTHCTIMTVGNHTWNTSSRRLQRKQRSKSPHPRRLPSSRASRWTTAISKNVSHLALPYQRKAGSIIDWINFRTIFTWSGGTEISLGIRGELNSVKGKEHDNEMMQSCPCT